MPRRQPQPIVQLGILGARALSGEPCPDRGASRCDERRNAPRCKAADSPRLAFSRSRDIVSTQSETGLINIQHGPDYT
jgi:hypothetical protein